MTQHCKKNTKTEENKGNNLQFRIEIIRFLLNQLFALDLRKVRIQLFIAEFNLQLTSKKSTIFFNSCVRKSRIIET